MRVGLAGSQRMERLTLLGRAVCFLRIFALEGDVSKGLLGLVWLVLVAKIFDGCGSKATRSTSKRDG